jgi:hypothetical protein
MEEARKRRRLTELAGMELQGRVVCVELDDRVQDRMTGSGE